MLKRCAHAFVLALAMVVVAPAQAGIQNESLPWPRQDEVLLYSSCGCADSCWKAELRDRRSHVLKARLRCDCEAVFFLRPPEKERLLAQTCSAFDGPDKFNAIGQAMEAQVR